MTEDYLTRLQGINTTFSSTQLIQQSNIEVIIIILAAISGIIGFIAVFGNLSNIIFIWRISALHNLNNLIILNLSFVDFLNGLIVLPMIIVIFLTKGKLPYSACLFQGFMLTLLYTASLMTSTAIAFDRLHAIMYPFRYHSDATIQKLTIILICVWSIPTVIATLPLLGLQKYGLGKYRYIDFCAISFIFYDENCIVYWILNIFVVACIVIILCCYSAIFYTAYRKTTQELTRGGNIKMSIRTTSLIVGTNFICWLPLLIINCQMYLNAVHSPLETTTISPHAKTDTTTVVIVTILFSNAAINPVIYMLTNSHIKKRILFLFRNNQVHNIS